jgi:dihydroorotate dehydrogenase
MYNIFRNIAFAMDAERAHHLSFKLAHKAHALGLMPKARIPATPTTVMGLTFPNRVGLAAGLDKNGEHIDVLANMGFGFIEIGTVTPRPQDGNPKPRMFRIPEKQAIINRMGFNNLGVATLLQNVSRSRFVQNGGILGINIGKNAITPIEHATDDYLSALSDVYAHASYITVNISSPNTKNLRDLQAQDALDELLSALKTRQAELANTYGRYVPMTLKIAPDLDESQIHSIADLLKLHRFDAVIATNTTLDKTATEQYKHGAETGGLSGAPVREKSTQVLSALKNLLNNEVPMIGVGGIMSGKDAQEKIDAGASLVQLYTGLIYRGPELVAECARQIQ